jgi:hypothetical protein
MAGHRPRCPAVFIQKMKSTTTAAVRRLKIEEHGDGWAGPFKPKIRLIGRWLEQAGFKPGNHVHIVCLAPGVLELRAASEPSQSA